MQPRCRPTTEKLITELQAVIDRDQQFIERGEELLKRWKAIACRMEQRFRGALGPQLQTGSSSTWSSRPSSDRTLF